MRDVRKKAALDRNELNGFRKSDLDWWISIATSVNKQDLLTLSADTLWVCLH